MSSGQVDFVSRPRGVSQSPPRIRRVGLEREEVVAPPPGFPSRAGTVDFSPNSVHQKRESQRRDYFSPAKKSTEAASVHQNMQSQRRDYSPVKKSAVDEAVPPPFIGVQQEVVNFPPPVARGRGRGGSRISSVETTPVGQPFQQPNGSGGDGNKLISNETQKAQADDDWDSPVLQNTKSAAPHAPMPSAASYVPPAPTNRPFLRSEPQRNPPGFGQHNGTFEQRRYDNGPTRFNGMNNGNFGAAPSQPPTPNPPQSQPVPMKPSFGFGQIRDRMLQAETTRWNSYPKLNKVFYKEHPDITKMSQAEADNIRLEKNHIAIEDLSATKGERPIPKPITTFEHAFHNFPDILREMERFTEPSPIQCQAWPVALMGYDFIGIAQTGTGKTLAFLLPIFIHIDNQPTRHERNGPACLILSPTRELALQIESEVAKYHYKGITSVCIYGGGSRRDQVNVCVKGVDIVIATPGRLNDLVASNIIKLDTISFLVLDEADRMLDMGFEPQIMKVLLDVRPDRQTIMTTATWPEGVRRLGLRYTKDAFLIRVGSLDLSACHSVCQKILIVDESHKRDEMIDFLTSLKGDDKVIVFVAKKDAADHLSSDLSLMGIDCTCMHGDRDQKEREQALKDIKSGVVRILVATDLAARGLDISDITHVFNFDFPRNIEEYVHRVGRTGRAGRTGTSITLMTRYDNRHAQELIKILEEAKQVVDRELHVMAEKWRQRQEREAMMSGNGRNGGYQQRNGNYRRDDVPITGEINPFGGFRNHNDTQARSDRFGNQSNGFQRRF